MSNTDDGIVVVARAICKVLGHSSWNERAARAAISIYESHLRDKGMVVVPRIPTKEMETKGWHRHMNSSAAWPDVCGEIYRAMLSASPVQSER